MEHDRRASPSSAPVSAILDGEDGRGGRRRPSAWPPAPVNPASSASSSACSAVVPVTSRDPVAPVPQTRAATAAGLGEPGVAGQPEVVVGRQVSVTFCDGFSSMRGERAQLSSRPACRSARWINA